MHINCTYTPICIGVYTYMIYMIDLPIWILILICILSSFCFLEFAFGEFALKLYFISSLSIVFNYHYPGNKVV